MATSFEQALLRLKEQLQVQADKDVALTLGLSATAFNDRKKRGAFPEDKLLALSARRPELGLDVGYVLGGHPMQKLQSSTQAILHLSSLLKYEPPMVWTALLQELMFSHGLTEAGARRIMETLKTERKAV